MAIPKVENLKVAKAKTSGSPMPGTPRIKAKARARAKEKEAKMAKALSFVTFAESQGISRRIAMHGSVSKASL